MTNLDKNSFTPAISNDTPVLVDFWASWCQPCRILGPVLEEIDDERGNKGEIFKLNIDDEPDVAAKYAVSTIPTLIVFQNGEEKERMIGVRPKADIVAFLDKYK